MSEYIEDFEIIVKGKKEIKNYIEQIKNLVINYPAYNILKSVLENKTDFINDTELYFHYSNNEYENITQKISFDEILKRLNKVIGEKHYEQSDKIKGEKSYECYRDKIEGLLPKNIFLHPWTCEPIDRDGVEYADIDIKNYAQIASDIIDLLKYANGTKNPGIEGFQNYFEIINELKEIYSEYLNTYVITLDYFYNITFEIINVLGEDNINNKNTFSFLDGKFTKTNIKIILKYLKYSFGKNIYDLGICLIVIGFFLILPIISSILLLILIDYRKKQKLENTNSDKLSNIINSSKNGGDHKRNDRLKISPYNPNLNLTQHSHDTQEEILSHQEENNEYDAQNLWKKIKEIQKKIKN